MTFLDTMLQMIVLGLPGRSLRLPTRIRSVCIDPAVHLEKVCEYVDEKKGVYVCIIIFSRAMWSVLCVNSSLQKSPRSSL